MNNKKRIMIMAGGTGGHVFPALAIADKLRKDGHEILWLGTRGRMEEQLVPKYGFPLEFIEVKGIRRNGLMAKLRAPFMIFKAILEALKVINKFKPDVVLGMGGYASGPGGVAAFLKRIPVVLHEQNAAAGLTNRLLFKISKVVMLGFPGAFSGNKVKLVGNPVREDIVALHNHKRDFIHEDLNIAIVGGSLGAQALNELVPQALKQCKNAHIKVTHQCGKGHEATVKEAYAQASFKYTVSEFITDMQNLYAQNDLIICRAGALTVAETAASGIPAIFVPLPSAVDDHQTKNAKFMEKCQAALVCPQYSLNIEKLSEIIDSLNNDRQKLASMSANAYANAVLDAASKACDIIIKVSK
ncbi:MAG: undecaprenyldiphospho-muramoylpentapeptide beta-N-acetylglucosaminyltransferase [Succinatimonas sp.]|nr:undecaprenyldiphospho-muramoylpentapeptide beta-N-acetylglucosaminyltransferase [Succinatimonas sp.]